MWTRWCGCWSLIIVIIMMQLTKVICASVVSEVTKNLTKDVRLIFIRPHWFVQYFLKIAFKSLKFELAPKNRSLERGYTDLLSIWSFAFLGRCLATFFKMPNCFTHRWWGWWGFNDDGDDDVTGQGAGVKILTNKLKKTIYKKFWKSLNKIKQKIWTNSKQKILKKPEQK